ncbi:MAG: septum formation inhibitor Maf [Gammaproteobacteria bacterium]|nr:septum formation inhibitor Maf [Gammaproteobacteria bacterium]
MDCALYLASQSPRRRRLLHQLGVRFDCLDAAVDETPRTGETARELVARLALAKACAGRAKALQPLPVLGADTEVVLDGEVLGKPGDAAGAALMLARLSGRGHDVMSAVALVTADAESVLISASRVRFRRLARTEIDRYCRSGEPLGKAGAYAIQGLAAAFIEHLEGSYSGVVGLPLFETAQLLHRAGIAIGGSEK